MFLLLKSLKRQLPPTPPCNLGPCSPCISCSLSPVCLAAKMTNIVKCESCIYEMGSNVCLIAKCKFYCDSD